MLITPKLAPLLTPIPVRRQDCLKAIGKAYHPECFACAYCGGLFGNSAFFLEDGLPYCESGKHMAAVI